MIDWTKYFDAVYCVHYVPQGDKLPGLVDELTRVGLWGSNVLHMRYTDKSRYDDVLMKSQGPAFPGDTCPSGIASLCCEVISILNEAIHLGYVNVLVLENDVRFLKDLLELERRFAARPDVELVQYDKFVYPNGERMLADCLANHSYNGDYFDPGGNVFYSGACFSIHGDGRKKLRDELERFLQAPDSAFAKIPDFHRAVATKNLAVQVVYRGTVTEQLYGVNAHHDGYVRGGLVGYEDYAVPNGYTYGGVVKGPSKTCYVCCVWGDSKFYYDAFAAATTVRDHTSADVKIVSLDWNLPSSLDRFTARHPDVPVLDGRRVRDLAVGALKGMPDRKFKFSKYTPELLGKLYVLCEPWCSAYDRIVVFDTDVRAFKNLDFLSTLDLPTHVGAIPDPETGCSGYYRSDIRTFKNPNTLVGEHRRPIHPDQTYFNAGVMVFDREVFEAAWFKAYLDHMADVVKSEPSLVLLEQDMLNLGFDVSPLGPGVVLNAPGRAGRVQPDRLSKHLFVHFLGENEQRFDYGNTRDYMSMKIVVYAITKNEEKFVDRWMDSMEEADAVVVLDTGSTDGTVEKLKARGAIVHTHEYHPWRTLEEYDVLVGEGKDPWRFDTSRNLSIDLAEKEDPDILVCTDLDEVLLPGWREKLEKAWKPGATTGRYEYVWSFNADGSDDRKFTYEKIHAPRTCRWTHPVHEILSYSVPRVDVDVPIRLEHHPDPAKSRGSYLQLLELSVREAPEDDRNMHYLGREYMFRGMWDKAIETLKRHLGLKTATWNSERAASMRFIGRCLKSKGDADGAELWLRRACDEDPLARESACELLELLYDAGRWREVVASGERCVSVKDRAGSYLTESKPWGAYPWDVLSIGYWGVADRKNALRCARKALELAPSDQRIANNVKVLERA